MYLPDSSGLSPVPAWAPPLVSEAEAAAEKSTGGRPSDSESSEAREMISRARRAMLETTPTEPT